MINASGSTNSILGNFIYGNSEQGIELGSDDGVTFNDVFDADSGANALQNFPILKTATSAGGNTTITGKMVGAASTTFRIEFFKNAHGQADAAGYGEAKTFLGSASVTTDASGNASFSQLLSGISLATGDTVTATATVDLGGGSYGSTSEFAGNILANEANLMISGTYTGNGVDNRTIAGLGFRPEVLLVMSANGTAVRTATMAGDAAKVAGSSTAVTSNILQSLTGDGFTVGTSTLANANGVTYHWVAFGAGDNLDVGRYTGTGATRTISEVGFQAEAAFILGESATQTVFRTSQSANTLDLSNNGAYTSGITALGANSFDVGSFNDNEPEFICLSLFRIQ